MHRNVINQFKIVKYFFVLFIIEALILVSQIYNDLFLIKILVNYLFLAGIIPIVLQNIKVAKIDIFSPMVVFHGLYLIFFGIPALDLVFYKAELIRRDEHFYRLALLYIIAGLHFFQIGYFSDIGKIIIDKKRGLTVHWSIKRIKIIVITISLISILSFLLILKLSGGASAYFLNIKNAMVELTTGSSFLFMAVILSKIPLLIWFCYSLKYNRFPPIFFIFTIFVFLLHLSLGERGPFVFLIVSLFVCYHYVKKKVRPVLMFSVTLLLMIFLTFYLKYRELTGINDNLKKIELQGTFFTANLYNHFIANFDYLLRVKDIVKYVPDKVDYQYGKTFINLMFKPIPSRIWAEKPESAAIIITRKIYPKVYVNKVTFVPSLIGELYLNFHVIGIMSGMLLFGVIMKSFLVLLKNNHMNLNFIVFYATIVPAILGQIRGDFAIVSTWLIFNLVFLIIALKFITIKTISVINSEGEIFNVHKN